MLEFSNITVGRCHSSHPKPRHDVCPVVLDIADEVKPEFYLSEYQTGGAAAADNDSVRAKHCQVILLPQERMNPA